MVKMNLRDFSVQVCMLKKTNGSFRSHQVRKKSIINDKNVSVYFSFSAKFSFYPVITYQYPTNLVTSSVTKFQRIMALCLSRYFENFSSFLGV